MTEHKNTMKNIRLVGKTCNKTNYNDIMENNETTQEKRQDEKDRMRKQDENDNSNLKIYVQHQNKKDKTR